MTWQEKAQGFIKKAEESTVSIPKIQRKDVGKDWDNWNNEEYKVQP